MSEFKRGDKVHFEAKGGMLNAYYIDEGVVEFLNCTWWIRDCSIPKDYVSVWNDTYWHVPYHKLNSGHVWIDEEVMEVEELAEEKVIEDVISSDPVEEFTPKPFYNPEDILLTPQQLQSIRDVLLQAPAKYVYDVIHFMDRLPKMGQLEENAQNPASPDEQK